MAPLKAKSVTSFKAGSCLSRNILVQLKADSSKGVFLCVLTALGKGSVNKGSENSHRSNKSYCFHKVATWQNSFCTELLQAIASEHSILLSQPHLLNFLFHSFTWLYSSMAFDLLVGLLICLTLIHLCFWFSSILLSFSTFTFSDFQHSLWFYSCFFHI